MKGYIHNLGRLFDEVVNQYGNKSAIVFTDAKTLTFAELSDKVDQMVSLLQRLGVKKNDVCAIAGVKKPLTYAGFLACLKLGVTYTFFDPESPLERLDKIFDQCKPALVLGYMADIEVKINERYRQHDLDAINSEPHGHFSVDVEGSCPAYIMFTSGSTGFPKGAVMTHANLINFIQWGKVTYGITSSDVHTNVNPLFFDNSVFDLYCSLFNGASLVPIEKKECLNPRTLLDRLETHQCTTWFSVPSLLIYMQTFRAIIPERWSSIKKIIFGGEGYPKGKLISLYDALKHNTTFYNVYGPTECTCICSSYTVKDDDFNDLGGFLPIGELALNFTFLILDSDQNITNEKGELWLGGPNVGLGYYNDSTRTNERFLQSPLHNHYRDIYYVTGDLVSFNTSDGKIYIHGRTDNQIKHMGYRIELEEIENAMCQIVDINEAAAFVVGSSNNNNIIVVYESKEEHDAANIKTQLKRLLPSYMIPSDVLRIDRIPKNANGKTDRLFLQKIFGANG